MPNRKSAETSGHWYAIDDKRRHPRFPIRLTDREVAQLKRVADTNSESMHQICIDAIRTALGEKTAVNQSQKPLVRTRGSQRVQCPKCNHALFDLLS